ncbi:protein of unknown function [Moritella yayanosii]|uniref:Uncharacterized protein n=1 Tax=Moritella yayanosii TaxID=69539 RepID=A0A330LJH8_9GAMM|nr:protein of unknown function [Moritella yayanosii]
MTSFRYYLERLQPFCFNTRVVDAGLVFNASAGRIGRCTKFPLQFGHT